MKEERSVKDVHDDPRIAFHLGPRPCLRRKRHIWLARTLSIEHPMVFQERINKARELRGVVGRRCVVGAINASGSGVVPRKGLRQGVGSFSKSS